MKRLLATLAGTLAAGAAALGLSAPAHADVFDICPDGHEGVVGSHTSCAFASDVREAYFATGQSMQFVAYSPVTGDSYVMTCVGRYQAHFTNGAVVTSTHCYGGNGAEVVIW